MTRVPRTALETRMIRATAAVSLSALPALKSDSSNRRAFESLSPWLHRSDFCQLVVDRDPARTPLDHFGFCESEVRIEGQLTRGKSI